MATDVLSPLADSRRVLLAKLTATIIDEAVKRVIPEIPAVPDTLFNSAI